MTTTPTPQEMPEEVWLIARNGACVSGAHFANIEAANHQIEQLRNYAGQAGYKAILVGGSALLAREREKWIAAYVERDKAARETAQLKSMFGTENLHLRGRIDDLETYLKIKTDAITQLEASHARLLEALQEIRTHVNRFHEGTNPQWIRDRAKDAIAAAEAQVKP